MKAIELKIIAGQSYLQVNGKGALEKVPPVPWYKVICIGMDSGRTAEECRYNICLPVSRII